MPDRYLRFGILTSEGVNKLSWGAEVFYRRLMSIADDYGRYDGRASILRAQLYPLKLESVSERNIEQWIGECLEASLVTVYSVESKRFIQIDRFNQRIRAASKWPPPPTIDSTPPHNAAYARASNSNSYPDSHLKERGVGKGNHDAVAEAVAWLRSVVGPLYRRADGQVWTYDEEYSLCEVARRPDARAEFAEIIAWKNKLPGDQVRFFPQSLSSFLSKWSESLDKARNYDEINKSASKPNPRNVGVICDPDQGDLAARKVERDTAARKAARSGAA